MDEHRIRGRNVETVRRFYQAERDRDLEAWSALWNVAGAQTFPTMGLAATVSGLDALRAVTREKFETRPPYGIRDSIAPFHDPTRVFVRLDLDFPASPVFVIWCLFHFDEDGLVREVEEMVDTGSAPSPGGDE